jgi:prepilin-type N-terminal cleavage/methylation domain-containing protein
LVFEKVFLGFMTSKFQFELLRILRKRTGLAKAFTLIELLIVVAIIGLLAAIGIPKYLDVRNNAKAGAAIGEIVGYGKECAVYVASGGIGTPPNTVNASRKETANDPNPCSTTKVNQYTRSIPDKVIVDCLDKKSTGKEKLVTVKVDLTGDLQCEFS